MCTYREKYRDKRKDPESQESLKYQHEDTQNQLHIINNYRNSKIKFQLSF